MKVSLRATPPGAHRFQYQFRWYSWALPLHIGIGTSWYPVEGSQADDLTTWKIQRVLIVDVLCMRMLVVVQGLLFPAEPEEGE